MNRSRKAPGGPSLPAVMATLNAGSARVGAGGRSVATPALHAMAAPRTPAVPSRASLGGSDAPPIGGEEVLRGPPGKDAPAPTAADLEAALTPALISRLLTKNDTLSKLVQSFALAEIRSARHHEMLRLALLTERNLTLPTTKVIDAHVTPAYVASRVDAECVRKALAASDDHLISLLVAPPVLQRIVEAVNASLLPPPAPLSKAEVTALIALHASAAPHPPLPKPVQVPVQLSPSHKDSDDGSEGNHCKVASATFSSAPLRCVGIEDAAAVEGRYIRVGDVVTVHFSMAAVLPSAAYLQRARCEIHMRLPLRARQRFSLAGYARCFSGTACITYMENPVGECALAQINPKMDTDDVAVVQFASPVARLDTTEARPKNVVVSGSYSYSLHYDADQHAL